MKLGKLQWERSVSMHGRSYDYTLVMPTGHKVDGCEIEIDLAAVRRDGDKWIVAAIGYVNWTGGASIDGEQHRTAKEAKLAAQGLLKQILQKLVTL